MAKISTTLYGELAFLPYQAEAPVGETLEFLTDVMQSSDGSEERVPLRSKARQSFQYQIPIQQTRNDDVFNTEYGAIRKKWAIPIWTEGQYVGTVNGIVTSIFCDTAIYDLRVNSLALLYSSSDDWQIIEITALTINSISFNALNNAISNAWLIPIRLGWISGNISKSTDGYFSKSVLTFDIIDNLNLSVVQPAQFLGNDIYYEPGLLNNGSVTKSIQQQEQTIDFELGPIEKRTSWNNSRYGTMHNCLMDGPVESRQFKEFLYRRSGKFRSFWQPSFESNLQITNVGNIVSTLYIKDNSFNSYAMRSHIVVRTINNNWYPFAISNPINLGNGIIQVTLSAPLNINVSEVVCISFLGLYRFNTDKIEINWIGNNVCQSEISILELTP